MKIKFYRLIAFQAIRSRLPTLIGFLLAFSSTGFGIECSDIVDDVLARRIEPKRVDEEFANMLRELSQTFEQFRGVNQYLGVFLDRMESGDHKFFNDFKTAFDKSTEADPFTVIDSGAGVGRLLVEFCAPCSIQTGKMPEYARKFLEEFEREKVKRSRILGITMETASREFVKESEQVGLVVKNIEDVQPTDLKIGGKPVKGDMVFDFFGALAYAKHFDVAIQNVLNATKTGGVLWMYVGGGAGASIATVRFGQSVVVNGGPDGKIIRLPAWLKQIDGLEVSVEKDAVKGDIFIRIKKTKDDVKIPALVPVRYLTDTPPIRVYMLGPPSQK